LDARRVYQRGTCSHQGGAGWYRHQVGFRLTTATLNRRRQLLASYANYDDAYLALGGESYLLSQQSGPMRWILQMTGAQTNKETGLHNLQLTAEHGHYLLPYARLLLAVAALRDHDSAQARKLLAGLAHEFPDNRLYAKELAKLQPASPANAGAPPKPVAGAAF